MLHPGSAEIVPDCLAKIEEEQKQEFYDYRAFISDVEGNEEPFGIFADPNEIAQENFEFEKIEDNDNDSFEAKIPQYKNFLAEQKKQHMDKSFEGKNTLKESLM